MKSIFAFNCFVFLIVLCAGVEEENTENENTIKIYQRIIPADVLRDFPKLCFASTKCSTFEPNQTWDLSPFCGRSTCINTAKEEPPKLMELVEDCGPIPKPNPKCKLDTEKTNKTAPFPLCCPKYICEDGVKLEYPGLSPVTEKVKEKE